MNASSAGGPADAGLDPVLHGVSLTQFAAVSAALAEGFALPAVLAVEGIAPASWPGADAAWKVRLVDESQKEGKGLFASYESRLAAAEDRLGRRISPLEADLTAWTSFLKAYSSHPSPFELLGGLQLRVSDVSRLSRLWARRMAGSTELQDRATELAQGATTALPELRIEPGELTPSSATSTRAAPVETAPVDAAWESPLVLPSAYRPGASKAPTAPGAPGGSPPEPPAPRAAPVPPGTALSVDVPRGPALPFAAADPGRPSPLAAPGVARPVVHRAPGALTGTAPLPEGVPRGPALPFAGASAGRGDSMPPVVQAPPALAGTAPLPDDVPRGPALPFAAAEPGRPSPLAMPGPAKPAVNRAPEALTGTSLSLAIPRGPALPFAKEPSGGTPGSGRAPASASPGSPLPPLPRLTLEQHASLTLELVVEPGKQEEILRRYGISVGEKMQLDAHFRQRLAEDRSLVGRWNEAYRAHHARFTGARRGPR
ncbi:hypothetical protein WME76_32645 [Sorangium sp. So ce119]|uniref:hypothetical protein n=1 Tax=Sorangium sp. So ce119 TaxID=3133279 RepID=UPI003F5F701F